MKIKVRLMDVFVPPGVQARLFQRLGQCPRVLPTEAAEKINALWRRRNRGPEEDIEAIDKEMEQIAVEASTARGVIDRKQE